MLVLLMVVGCGSDSVSNSFGDIDADGDGVITFAEFEGSEDDFSALDTNNDGELSAFEFAGGDGSEGEGEGEGEGE